MLVRCSRRFFLKVFSLSIGSLYVPTLPINKPKPIRPSISRSSGLVLPIAFPMAFS